MDDTLVDAYCHENAFGHRVKPQAAELKNKSFRNYEKLVMLYEKDTATGKHAETGSDMLKRNAHKNSKRSSVDSFTIDEIDEMGYINTDSLEDIEGREQGDQSQATNDVPTPNVYLEAPTPIKNKKSKHDHLESMTSILRGGMDNLAGAINRLSSLSPISENEIWNMLEELNLKSGVDTKAYIFLCQNASACRILIG
ncbi:hypothetical protein T459_30074 [Capsicum annuum]|uniref:Uncharacterized protein n=1 Tax=Capsicum annuum TaxID=4072 RepID=A0A2G2Y7I3_CAPAN|nr:hypothetical protein T459_30074 [Capsicum annuum]